MNSAEKNGQEWKPWTDHIIKKMDDAMKNGIHDIYKDYSTPVDGFFFELHADLPYGNEPLKEMVVSKLSELPEFQKLEEEFKEKYGQSFLRAA